MKIIVTGATGMVGEGVAHECLNHPSVSTVLIINRRPSGMQHPKLVEIVHEDFFNLEPVRDSLTDYDACFFCLGVSSVGMASDEYFKMTYTLTMHMATLLSEINPGSAFCYVSGASTDSTEKGRLAWARIKGKTENAIMKLPFDRAYMFRPGFILPTPGLKRTHKFYRYINWLFPIGRKLYRKGFCTLKELGLAMINSLSLPEKRKILEGNDIISLGKS